MSNLNLDINYFGHVKTRRLAERLGRGSEVIPIKLWCYTAKHYAEDGILAGHSSQEIEQVVNWWGSKGRCCDALVDLKFLDRLKHGFRVHGWKERSGHLSTFAIRARAAANARWSKDRERRDGSSVIDAQASPSIATNQPNQPDQPNRLNQPTNGEHVGGRRKGGALVGGDGTLAEAGAELARLMNVRRDPDDRSRSVNSLLLSYGVGRKARDELAARPDITQELVRRTYDALFRSGTVRDLPSVLVTKLRESKSNTAR